MGKDLSAMTLAELWRLFPIRLTAHQDVWRSWFMEECALLSGAMDGMPARISHIGSTAVEGIWAKPIVDILLETDAANLAAAENAALACGYRVMSRGGMRISLNKGYTESGFAERVFHLHLRVTGDHDELLFREYLRTHPEEAQAYEALKLSLWKQFEHDRDAYTAAKADFVARATALAKAQMTVTDRYIFRPMAETDVPAMFSLVQARIRWMDETGVRHWNATKYDEAYPPEHYAAECARGTMYALTDAATGGLVAAGALRTSDGYWGDDGVSAVYLHHFVSKIGSGGAGAVFLKLAEAWAAARGAEYFRLDSADDNPPLAKYYEDKGYLPTGACADGPYTGILRQKKL